MSRFVQALISSTSSSSVPSLAIKSNSSSGQGVEGPTRNATRSTSTIESPTTTRAHYHLEEETLLSSTSSPSSSLYHSEVLDSLTTAESSKDVDTTTFRPSELPTPSRLRLSTDWTPSIADDHHRLNGTTTKMSSFVSSGDSYVTAGHGSSQNLFDWIDFDISLADLTGYVASLGMIFGAVLPYVPQYLEIKKSKNSSGFSTYVCLTLITANILRIIFWFGKKFETPLLIQSVVMLIAMFLMMEICLRMRRRRRSGSLDVPMSRSTSKTKTFIDGNNVSNNNDVKNLKKNKKKSNQQELVVIEEEDVKEDEESRKDVAEGAGSKNDTEAAEEQEEPEVEADEEKRLTEDDEQEVDKKSDLDQVKKNSRTNSKEVIVVMSPEEQPEVVVVDPTSISGKTPLTPSDSSHKVKSSSNCCTKILKSISSYLRLGSFWQWPDLLSYIECCATFTVIMAFLMYMFMECTVFVETLGYASLGMESMLALPQLIKNFRSKSTVGMSIMMVLLWAGGDLFKTGYFIVKQTPAQFIMCGVTQVTIDMCIMGQVSYYSRSTPTTTSPSGSQKEAKL